MDQIAKTLRQIQKGMILGQVSFLRRIFGFAHFVHEEFGLAIQMIEIPKPLQTFQYVDSRAQYGLPNVANAV